MCQKSAILSIGSHKFKIIERLDICCIKVEVEIGKSNTLVRSRIESFLRVCIEECMPYLYYKVMLPYGEANDQFLPLEKLLIGDVSTLTLAESPTGKSIPSKYSSWLRVKDILTKYDFFLSYRWGGDSQLVTAIHDWLSNFPFPSQVDLREVNVFLDQRRIKDGTNFKSSFAKSILQSTVVIPFISLDSLQKMIINRQRSDQDSVLIEWILALEGKENLSCNIKRIFPVVVGRRDKFDGTIHNIFTEIYTSTFSASGNIFDSLPDSISDPLLVASLGRARELLSEIGMEPSNVFTQKFVKSIVSSVMENLGFMLHEHADQSEKLHIREISQKAHNVLKDCIESSAATEVIFTNVCVCLFYKRYC